MRVHINQSYRVLAVKTLNRKPPASLHTRAVTHLTPSETCTHALHLQCSACFVTEGSRTPRSARSRLSLTHPTACLMPRTPVPTPCVVCLMFSGRRAPLCLTACLVSRTSLHLCFAYPMPLRTQRTPVLARVSDLSTLRALVPRIPHASESPRTTVPCRVLDFQYSPLYRKLAWCLYATRVPLHPSPPPFESKR